MPEYPYAEKKQVDYYDDYEPVTDTVDNVAVSEVQMEIDTDKKKDVSLDVEATSSIDKITYEEYKRMTPLEKAQSCGFTRLRSYDAVKGVVKLKFMELEHKPTTDEFMEETELLYKGMRELVVRTKVGEVLETVEKNGLPFICWTPKEKAGLLQFQLDENSYNAVCKTCGIDTSDMDEVFEDYQAIYDKTVEMQGDKEVGRKDGGRDRVR